MPKMCAMCTDGHAHRHAYVCVCAWTHTLTSILMEFEPLGAYLLPQRLERTRACHDVLTLLGL